MTENSRPILEINNLIKFFGDRTVLRLDRWSLQAGHHGLILGASGSGKSTLLHMIAGLLRPSEGRIMVQGQALFDRSARDQDRARGQQIGLVLQNLHLIAALSVRDNLRLAQSLAGLAPDLARIDSLLEQLGMAALAARKPETISHGERQRVAIARAVINRPTLLLADEPTSALDDRHTDIVLRLLMDQAAMSGATLIVATHDARITTQFDQRLTLEATP